MQFDKIFAHTSFIGNTGYASHARNFFTTLNNFTPVKVRNFTVGETWKGNSLTPHDKEPYLTEVHKDMLIQQTLMVEGSKREDFFIYDGSDNDIKGVVPNIVLMETDHYYFYDNYTGPKIAYNVWESTLYPTGFFSRLMQFDQLWVPSKWHRDCVITQGMDPDKVKVVPEGVEGSIFFPEELKAEDVLEEYEDGRFKFVLFGRWDYRKSITEIISTFLTTFSKDEPIDLVVSIDNPYSGDGLNSTEDRLKHHGFKDDRIKVKHFPSRDDYVKYLKLGNVFVSCARSEGWNLPLIESMACGTPSIYSDWGAQLEFAEGKGLPVKILGERPVTDSEKHGYKMFSGDTPGNYCEPDLDDLSKVMRDAYVNYSKHKQKAIVDSKKIRDKFSWENAAKKAVSILEDFSVVSNNKDSSIVNISVEEVANDYKLLCPKVYFYPIAIFNNKKIDVIFKDSSSNAVLHIDTLVFNNVDAPNICYWTQLGVPINDIDGIIVEVFDGKKLIGKKEKRYSNSLYNNDDLVGHGGWWPSIKIEVHDGRMYEKYFPIEKNDVVVDIGAHAGFFSMTCSGRDIEKCYSLEPWDINFKDLKSNISLTGEEDKFVLINKAIDTESGVSNHNFSTDMGFIGRSADGGGMDISTISFLDFIKEYEIDHINFLKMDCEGGEFAVINKEENWEYLENNVDKIAGEIHLNNNRNNEAVELLSNLKKLGFDVILNSVDGVDITNDFYNDIDYFQQVHMYAQKVNRKEKSDVIKLNLGCGDDLRDGYINVDLYNNNAEIQMDVRQLFYDDNSVDEIFSSHVLEHFSKHETIPILIEWNRVLKPGGKLIMDLPDLEWCMLNWLNTPERDKWGWAIDSIFGHQVGDGEIHQAGFTKSRLEDLLTTTGYNNITIVNHQSHGQTCFLIHADKA